MKINKICTLIVILAIALTTGCTSSSINDEKITEIFEKNDEIRELTKEEETIELIVDTTEETKENIQDKANDEEKVVEVDVSNLVNNGDSVNSIYYLEGENTPFTGIATSYYNSGQLEELYSLENGFLNGDKIFYFEDGKIEYKSTYKKGKQTGVATSYYENGNPESIFNYDDEGRWHGKIQNYYEDNTLKSEGEYISGVPVGKVYWYYESGSIQKEYAYNDEGEYHGDYIVYYEDGQIESIDSYVNGEIK